ncbi:MAG: ABC transporter ATP-binding protein [Hyphomicrobiaceae bacterium]|nr:ABC transporter ATP-binding protein [Hyphomicrobiaceae bacterium]
MIEIENVSKHFVSRDRERIAALINVSLSIRRNEFVCLVGPSGCGKSTLLRLVGGLLRVSQGQVIIDGQPVAEPRAETGIVFQAPTLLPWASVLDNVLFPLKIMKRVTPSSSIEAKRLLKLVGLEGFEGKYPRELSGGMQMRAGICRALVHDPDILLMDEPFGALDALTREELTLELMRLWREQPKTVLFVTHSIPESVMLADRVVVLSPRPGRVADIVPVEVPRPRRFGMEGLDEFQRAAGRIRELIFGTRRDALH